MSTMELERVADPVETQPTRRAPWTGVTTMLEDAEEGISSEDMLKKAGLDWDVAVRPLWSRMNSGDFVQHEKAREVYRVDTEQSLGMVRGRYTTFSNREAFAFGDAIVESGEGKWVTAGEQLHGTRVFMTMKLGEEFTVLGEDAYNMYLFIRTSHGGGTSVVADVVPFRAWCLNQSQIAREEGVTHWSVPHTTTIVDRVKEAKDALQIAGNYETRFQQLTETLALTEIDDAKAKALIESVIPERRSRRDDIITEILATYHTSPTVEPYRGTAYGLLNGATEYMDHVKKQRSDNARFESIMFGEGSSIRNALSERLLALA